MLADPHDCDRKEIFSRAKSSRNVFTNEIGLECPVFTADFWAELIEKGDKVRCVHVSLVFRLNVIWVIFEQNAFGFPTLSKSAIIFCE
jgi:hypothetical protein